MNNWQKSDDLLIVHCTPANLRWRTAVQCTAHMLAMWREYLVKRNTSQAKVSEYHHQNIAALQSRRREEEVKARYEEEPMRGSITNKQTTQVPLADLSPPHYIVRVSQLANIFDRQAPMDKCIFCVSQ